MKRHIVQIPAEQVQKILEIKEIRKDLIGFPLSKVIHSLLQERLAEIFQEQHLPPKERISSGKWFEYIREPVPVHIWAPISLGVVRNSQEMIGYPFTEIVVFIDPTRSIWGNKKEDIYGIGGYLLGKLKDSSFAESYYQKHVFYYEQLKELCDKVKLPELKLLSKTELYTTYSNFYEQLKKFHALSFDIDAIDIVLEQRMKDKLQALIQIGKSAPTSKELMKIFNILTTPVQSSYIHQEKLELLSLALEINEDKELQQLFKYDTLLILEQIKSHKRAISVLNNLVSKFWWTSLGWNSGKTKSVGTFINEIKEILHQNNLIEQEQELQSSSLLKQKEKIRRELDFDQEMDYYLDTFEKYALFHDQRKEIQMKGTQVLNSFLQEVARRQQHKYEDLLWCWPSEIQRLILTGEINLSFISKRKEAFFYLVAEDSLEQFTGEIACRRRNEEFGLGQENITNFQGLTASSGKVSGIAKVCYSLAEASDNVNTGDILVTSMTTPDFIPAMKRAAAIVTNEGGITCHAAIVARELGIPCIVGTIIATKTINDGDVIEVNANHGVVNIIKRANYKM